jgi:hypothetical protein
MTQPVSIHAAEEEHASAPLLNPPPLPAMG